MRLQKHFAKVAAAIMINGYPVLSLREFLNSEK